MDEIVADCLQASVDQTVYEFTTFVNTFAEENLFYQISVSGYDNYGWSYDICIVVYVHVSVGVIYT